MSERLLVYDIEADALLEKSTTVHCIVAKEVGTDNIWKFWDNKMVMHNHSNTRDKYLDRVSIVDVFSQFDKVICHNQLTFDMRMLIKFYDIDLDEMFGSDNIIDTFVWSQVLNPDREMPKGCPTTIIPPKELREQGFKPKKIGPHGLDSWGYRVGRKKPAIHDCRTFTPSILNRCVEDVLINEGTFLSLCKEGNI